MLLAIINKIKYSDCLIGKVFLKINMPFFSKFFPITNFRKQESEDRLINSVSDFTVFFESGFFLSVTNVSVDIFRANFRNKVQRS